MIWSCFSWSGLGKQHYVPDSLKCGSGNMRHLHKRFGRKGSEMSNYRNQTNESMKQGIILA